MLDAKIFDKNDARFESYKNCFVSRKGDPKVLDQIVQLSEERKKLIFAAETLRSEQKAKSQLMASLKKEGQSTDNLLAELGQMSKEVKNLEVQAETADQNVRSMILHLPNFFSEYIPLGSDESANRIERTVGQIKEPLFKPKDHVELGEKLGILHPDRATKVTGARFSFLTGAGARLERALIQFMLDQHSQEHGYQEVVPPYIVNSESMTGTGQFPKFKEDAFHLEGTDYHLIPTAEVPVTNFHRDEVVNLEAGPIRYCAFSPCFRSEAGSHGRDTRGLIRQHQFHKVELVSFCKPHESEAEHERLTGHAEVILKKLGLSYRVVTLSSGDIGFSAYRCYDLEVWMPSQETYREISSCSNFNDFQARRANIRYRDAQSGKLQFVHTLNGSGLAVGRTLIALIENYQQEDGSISIPEILWPYMGGLKKIERV